MPSPTRPVVVPIWTQGNNAVRQQPTNGEQFTGFTPDFRPPAGWHNWLFGIFSDWVEWLDFTTQNGNLAASNVGHNVLTGLTLQAQLDECDAFLSSLGLKYLTMMATANPAVYVLSESPVNQSALLVFLDGLDEDPTADFTFAVISGVPTVTFTTAPAAGQHPKAVCLTANQPGAGGTLITGGFAVYGSIGAPIVATAAGGVTSTNDQRALIFLVSNAGAVPITANPQVSPGTKVGQELRLVGASDVNYIQLSDGNGLKLIGPILLKNKVSIDLWWDGAVWSEDTRSN